MIFILHYVILLCNKENQNLIEVKTTLTQLRERLIFYLLYRRLK